MENIKQNTLKYKILFILSFMFLILLFFNANVFASFDFTGTDKVEYSIDDLPVIEGYSNYIIDKRGGWFYCFYIPDGHSVKYFACSGANDGKVSLEVKDGAFIRYSYYPTVGWSLDSEDYFGTVILLDNYKSDSHIPFIYSTVPIYDLDGETVVFQQPAQGVLAQVLEKEIQNNPKMVLVEIQKVLILIIAAVVSLLGFRKAWKILRTSLNQS